MRRGGVQPPPQRRAAGAGRPAPWPARRRLRAAGRPASGRATPSATSCCGVISNRLRAANAVGASGRPGRGRRLVALVVLARARHQRLAALDAQHLARPRGQRQREVAEAAEPVDHALVLLRVQQAQRARHQHAVDVRVDLGEVGRLERHGDAELGQRVVPAAGPPSSSSCTVSGPLGCSHHCTPGWSAREGRSLARSPALTAAPGGAAPAPSRSSPQASSICGQVSIASMRADQRAQRQQQVADVRRHARGIRGCRPRSGSCARGSRPARCPSCARGAREKRARQR